jgi:predicted amidophosphoribosyltransferase
MMIRAASDGALQAAGSLLGLVLPVDCPGCGAADLALCPRCRAALAPAAGRLEVLPSPVGVPAFSATEYGGVVARIVVAWKERGRHDLARPLAGALAVALGGLLARLDDLRPEGSSASGPVLVVPVPSSRRARRQRGEDTVRRLALLAAARVRRGAQSPGPEAGPARLPHVRVLPALRLVRAVADQAGLSAQARRTNLVGALEVRRSVVTQVRGRVCVVVDDVLTTGSTLAEAAGILGAAGALVTGVATICVTRRDAGVTRRPMGCRCRSRSTSVEP